MMRLKRRDRKGEEGFTLIELAIALAILGILVAIAVPTYLTVRDKAYDSEAKQILGEIRTMAWSYFLEQGDWSAVSDIGDLGLNDPYASENWTYTAVHNTGALDVCATWNVAAEADHSWLMILYDDGTADLQEISGVDCTP